MDPQHSGPPEGSRSSGHGNSPAGTGLTLCGIRQCAGHVGMTPGTSQQKRPKLNTPSLPVNHIVEGRRHPRRRRKTSCARTRVPYGTRQVTGHVCSSRPDHPVPLGRTPDTAPQKRQVRPGHQPATAGRITHWRMTSSHIWHIGPRRSPASTLHGGTAPRPDIRSGPGRKAQGQSPSRSGTFGPRCTKCPNGVWITPAR